VTTIRKLSEVKGSVFDLPKSQTLADDDCNVLLVSSRTLYFIQTFATGEIDFLARYASAFLDGAKFIVADSSADLDQINNLQNRYEIEVVPVTADLISELQNITLAIQQLAGADCTACGTEVDPPAAPFPTIGPGEDFETLPEYETYKCEAVNWLLDALIDIFTKLDAYDVAFWTTVTVTTGGALITAILATTLLAGILPIIAGIVISMVVALIAGATIDIEAIKDLLIASRDDLACLLFLGADAQGSKDLFIAELGALGLNAAETALISLMIPFNVVNNLYELNPAIEGHPTPSPCVDCAFECDLFFQTFVAGGSRGSGDLTKDGSTRTLTGVKHPTLSFWYVSPQVALLSGAQSYSSSCSPMPAGCVGTNDENWDFKPISLSGYNNAGSQATRCTGGSNMGIWTGGPPTLGVTYRISWCEFISTTPFTLDCSMTQVP